MVCSIFSTLAMAPVPVSPHTNVFTTGGMMKYPQDSSSSSCGLVTGCSHIMVFMAGATQTGFEKSQARRVLVKRLSAMPMESLARVLADKGATTHRSAHFLSSM